MDRTLKDLLYQFIASGNPAKDPNPNRTFHAEFKQALKDDETFQKNRTFDRFLLICENLIYKCNKSSSGTTSVLYEVQQEEQEQPADQSGTNGSRSG